MGYTLNAAQKAPILDETGQPLAVSRLQGTPPPYNVGGVAQMQDDGTGHLEVVANMPGSCPFAPTVDGTQVTHTVTVTAAPFDWTLGTPVAK